MQWKFLRTTKSKGDKKGPPDKITETLAEGGGREEGIMVGNSLLTQLLLFPCLQKLLLLHLLLLHAHSKLM